MQDRLCGREQEYAMGVEPPWQPPKIHVSQLIINQSPEDIRMAEFAAWRAKFVDAIIGRVAVVIPSFYSSYSRLWLGNGSLIYKDLPNNVLESASAESRPCSLDGILQEKAAEMILDKALAYVMLERRVKSLNLYKNNVAPKDERDLFDEVSYGSHHNYSYLASKKGEVFRVFQSFVPASMILSGNGHVFRYHGKFMYLLSQRANHIVSRQSNTSTHDRPIVNIRPESLMRKSAFLNRLHLISRDATRCEFQTWLVDGVTHLVLRLIEEGWDLPPSIELVDPVSELKIINFSFGANLDYKVRCGNSGSNSVNLIQYNKIFLKAAKQLTPLSANEKKCLEEWERVLELLEAKAFHKLVGELDWVTKWYLIKSAMKKNKFGLDDARAWRIDWDYHNISSDPRKSLYAALEERGRIKHLVSSEDVKKAITTPPETRAKVRGKFIRLFWGNINLRNYFSGIALDWCAITIPGNLPNKLLVIPFGEKGNPFSTESSVLEEFYKNFSINDS